MLNAQSLVMIQCVGCRNEDRNYCSRICCSQSVKNALELKEINPQMDISILFRDMRTYGFKEDYYREASEKDVKFIRYEPEDSPRWRPVRRRTAGRPQGHRHGSYPGQEAGIDADILALAAAVIPSATTKEVAGLVQGHVEPGRLLQGSPCQIATGGVRHGRRLSCAAWRTIPSICQETINQAYGAAGRVMTLLSQDTVIASGSVCEVDERQVRFLRGLHHRLYLRGHRVL